MSRCGFAMNCAGGMPVERLRECNHRQCAGTAYTFTRNRAAPLLSGYHALYLRFIDFRLYGVPGRYFHLGIFLVYSGKCIPYCQTIRSFQVAELQKGLRLRARLGRNMPIHASSTAHTPYHCNISYSVYTVIYISPAKTLEWPLMTYTTSSFPPQSSLKRRPITRYLQKDHHHCPGKFFKSHTKDVIGADERLRSWARCGGLGPITRIFSDCGERQVARGMIGRGADALAALGLRGTTIASIRQTTGAVEPREA